MHPLVELGRSLQAAGTDCLVLDVDRVALAPTTIASPSSLALWRTLAETSGDQRRPLHVQRGTEWLRAEPLAQRDGHVLIALLPRTRQHVVEEADRLQNRRDALQDLAASTAREMNDAMTIVQGRLELLMAFALENPESAARHASIALEHSERITSALHNLRLVGSGGMLHFQGLSVDVQIRRALATAVDDPASVHVDVDPALSIVGHEPAVQGVLTGVLRAVMGESGGTVTARQLGDEIVLTCTSATSRHSEIEALPLGIVSALVEALGGRLRSEPTGVSLSLPRELEERGLIPDGMAVLAVGQAAFTQAVKSFLSPDTPVRVARSVETADTSAADLYAVVAELLLPGRSGLAMVQQLATDRPGLRTLLVTHDPIERLAADVHHLAGPIDRVRLVRALTGE